jgi:fused signal recognition particle receptor
MLGWFKKKFSKKKTDEQEQAAVEAAEETSEFTAEKEELDEEQLATAEESAEPEVVDEPEPAVDDPSESESESESEVKSVPASESVDESLFDDLFSGDDGENVSDEETAADLSDVLDLAGDEPEEELFAPLPEEDNVTIETELDQLVGESSPGEPQSGSAVPPDSKGLEDLTAALEFETDIVPPEKPAAVQEQFGDTSGELVAEETAEEEKTVVVTPFDEVLAEAEQLLESAAPDNKETDDAAPEEQITGESGEDVTHIDIEELECIEDEQESSELSESEPVEGVDGEVTVVAVEELEIVTGEASDIADQDKGKLSEELLRELFPAPPPEQEKPQRVSMFQRLQERLGKTRDSFVYRLDALFLGKKVIDHELLDELEEILITADLGVTTTMELLDEARSKVKRNELSDPQALKGVLRDKILAYLQESDEAAELVMPESGPFVIMVVGVNGVGKTTTIGKIASKFIDADQSVLLVAGDTFRAAAIDQLKIWGDRVGVEVVSGEPGCDPSSVVFDGIARGAKEDVDVIIIDTAGRLHTSVNLMEELKKIRRVIGKKLEGAPHEVLLVIDATTGQNAISQAKTFHEAVGVSGLAVTKLDGTAKGGIIANVCRELKIPVRFIGIGEQVDDLRDFDPEEFVQALFSESEEENA